MARALIVGCGCQGRALGTHLAAEGWVVRGTSRSEVGLAAIKAAGIEPARADPASPGTVLDLVSDAAVVHWLLGSAVGEERAVSDLHGPRLERLLEKLVDTPVRGFVYEASGAVDASRLREGARIVERAGARWRIRAEVVLADPSDHEAWLVAMLASTAAAVRPSG